MTVQFIFLFIFLFLIVQTLFFRQIEFFDELLPVSGSEPDYFPSKWNNLQFIKTNNCYAYVLNDLDIRDKKPQPGYFSGIKKDYSSCHSIFSRVLKDNPQIYKIGSNSPCKSGYYKGYLALHPNKDYHFYRQDSNGYWSHKPGKNKVTNLDSKNKLITNPSKANKDYKQFNYSNECNFFCIPSNDYQLTNSL